MDTRFAKDALVLIIAKVESYHQYLQMLGRSSRSRSISEGILYVSTNEKPNQVMERIKRHNMGMMMNLEHLINLLSKKSKDQGLVATLRQCQEEGKKIRSFKDLENSVQ